MYQAQRRPLFGFFWARLGEREEALDLVQEVFTRAWRCIDALRALPEDRQRAWLFVCARRLVVDRYRHHAAVRQAEPFLLAEARSPQETPAGTHLEEAEELRRLEIAIRGLPAVEREALCLVVLGGMTSRQVGEALGLPAGTVRYRLLCARRRLRHTMESDMAGKGGGDHATT